MGTSSTDGSLLHRVGKEMLDCTPVITQVTFPHQIVELSPMNTQVTSPHGRRGLTLSCLSCSSAGLEQSVWHQLEGHLPALERPHR